MSEQDAINAVLAGFTPVGEDHPKAQETLASVRELLEARNGVVERIEEIDGQLLTTATVEVGVIRPGDTVIFGSRHLITADQAEAMKRHIAEVLPGITPVILGGLRVEAIYREGSDE